MTARRPADIASELRDAIRPFHTNPRPAALLAELDAHAAEHVCVPKDRWPTADEIADMRADAVVLRDGWISFARCVGARLTAFLDRLEPPAEPQADDDVDPVVSLNVPLSAVQALWGGMEAGRPLDWIPALHAFGDAARAALDAQGQS